MCVCRAPNLGAVPSQQASSHLKGGWALGKSELSARPLGLAQTALRLAWVSIGGRGVAGSPSRPNTTPQHDSRPHSPSAATRSPTWARAAMAGLEGSTESPAGLAMAGGLNQRLAKLLAVGTATVCDRTDV